MRQTGSPCQGDFSRYSNFVYLTKDRFSPTDFVGAVVGPLTGGVCVVLNIVCPAPIKHVKVGVDGHYETNVISVMEG